MQYGMSMDCINKITIFSIKSTIFGGRGVRVSPENKENNS
jgi:hypothetical protein